ncbi:MAG: large conductance mechanosensitive channel protein MscL [Candidatus Izemoplasmatales bacterium]|jgi:large conductance mechanosensitive channel|nr:large conductance mechanosensitive channel protein MscL [Candidatus Izemoplasmatales bacterium]MDD3864712.1 large conductance mechanosensitive channel protein MscL [Candidatus Izemoplasmatales bacterium]
MKKFFKEFGAFISKGNALDLAVGIVIGTAFNAIIKSLVSDIIMPLLGLIGGTEFNNLFWVMKGPQPIIVDGAYIFDPTSVVLRYGSFIQSIIDFLIIALAVFLALKVVIGIRKSLDLAKTKLLRTEEASQEIKTK